MVAGCEMPLGAATPEQKGPAQIQAKRQREGIEDSLSGSFRDPHFQLVAVNDVALKDKTTQPVPLLSSKSSPIPLPLPRVSRVRGSQLRRGH